VLAAASFVPLKILTRGNLLASSGLLRGSSRFSGRIPEDFRYTSFAQMCVEGSTESRCAAGKSLLHLQVSARVQDFVCHVDHGHDPAFLARLHACAREVKSNFSCMQSSPLSPCPPPSKESLNQGLGRGPQPPPVCVPCFVRTRGIPPSSSCVSTLPSGYPRGAPPTLLGVVLPMNFSCA
jgi:hypothetical protein